MALVICTFGSFSSPCAGSSVGTGRPAAASAAASGWSAEAEAGCLGATAQADSNAESVTMAKAFFKAHPTSKRLSDSTLNACRAYVTATRFYIPVIFIVSHA